MVWAITLFHERETSAVFQFAKKCWDERKREKTESKHWPFVFVAAIFIATFYYFCTTWFRQ
jgi:hypothetical protein